MTNEPGPTDYRRAKAMIVHHGKQDFQGVNAVIMEAAEAGRPTVLMCALVDVYDAVTERLLTDAGLVTLRQAFQIMEAKHIDSHNRRAAAFILAYLCNEPEKTAAVLQEANKANRAKELFFAIMDAYSVLLPMLYSPGAQAEFSRSLLWSAAQEDPDNVPTPESEM